MTKNTQVITTHKNQKKEIYIPRARCLFQFDNLCHLKVSQILCSPSFSPPQLDYTSDREESNTLNLDVEQRWMAQIPWVIFIKVVPIPP